MIESITQKLLSVSQSELWSSMLDVIVWLLFYSIVVSGIFYNPLRFRKRFSIFLCTIFASAALGYVTGQITGQSRDPAVAAVLPGILGLVGGIMIYMIGTTRLKHQFFAAIFTFSLAINLLIGIHSGAANRQKAELFSLSNQEKAKLFAAKRRLLSEREFEQNLLDMEKKYQKKFDTKIEDFWKENKE